MSHAHAGVPFRRADRLSGPAGARALLAATLAMSGALAGCQSGKQPGTARAQLVSLAGCDDALAFVRQVELAKMNKAIDDRIAAFDQGQACARGGFGGEELNAVSDAPGASPAPSAPTTGTTTGSSDKATNSSTTNNQVAGVDEADFVKNDGKYVYLAQNGVLRIVDAWPAASAHQLSKTTLDGTPKKLFVEGDRALVYVSVPDPRRSSTSPGASPRYGSGRECTYGYDCDFTGDGTATKLEIFDIVDRSNPIKVRELFLSGSLIAARRIGKATHTVVADNLQLFPELVYYTNENLCDYVGSATNNYSYSPTPLMPPATASVRARAVYEALREANLQIIMNKDLSGILPSISDSSQTGGVLGSPAQLCDGLYRAQLLDGASFTTLVSVAIDEDGPAHTATILSSPGAVYASASALYMSVPSERSASEVWYSDYEDTPQASSVHKFRIGEHPADTAYLGSGLIKGRVLNQFAMDEKDGYLRVASTTGHVPSPDVESQLTVLTAQGADLVQVGLIEHLAPVEDIRSVRFDGDKGFIVTFKKTDPLFVLDLASPTDPKIVGELKIPGFSTYIHLLDETHLLSIGYDANDHDSFAFFDGVLIQIFDIGDPSAPTLAHRYKIGTRGSSSEALANHLAFNYFAPDKMLALPMTICEGGGDGTFGDILSFSGLMLFDIDAQTGISEHGRVSYPTPDLSTYNNGNAASCFHWWSQAGSEVQRSIFMDRYVYAISGALMKVQSVDALGSDLQSIDLEPPAPTSGGVGNN